MGLIQTRDMDPNAIWTELNNMALQSGTDAHLEFVRRLLKNKTENKIIKLIYNYIIYFFI